MRRISAGRRLAITGGLGAAGALRLGGMLVAGAITTPDVASAPTSSPTTTSTVTATGACTAAFNGTREQRAAARTAWAKQYGDDRTTMADEPDVDAASPFEQVGATDLLTRTR